MEKIAGIGAAISAVALGGILFAMNASPAMAGPWGGLAKEQVVTYTIPGSTVTSTIDGSIITSVVPDSTVFSTIPASSTTTTVRQGDFPGLGWSPITLIPNTNHVCAGLSSGNCTVWASTSPAITLTSIISGTTTFITQPATVTTITYPAITTTSGVPDAGPCGVTPLIPGVPEGGGLGAIDGTGGIGGACNVGGIGNVGGVGGIGNYDGYGGIGNIQGIGGIGNLGGTGGIGNPGGTGGILGIGGAR